MFNMAYFCRKALLQGSLYASYQGGIGKLSCQSYRWYVGRTMYMFIYDTFVWLWFCVGNYWCQQSNLKWKGDDLLYHNKGFISLTWPLQWSAYLGEDRLSLNLCSSNSQKKVNFRKMAAVFSRKYSYFNIGYCKYKDKGCKNIHPEETCVLQKVTNKDCPKRHTKIM